MTSKTYRILSLALAAVVLLAACSPAPAPAPAMPTVDLTDIANRVSTAVAGTVAAQQTGTAAAQPPATETPEPSVPTITPVLPTATPFVVPTSTSYSGGGGSTKYKYSCDIVRQRPFDNTEFRPGDDFDIKWTIVNTGTATWPAGTDFKYLSGPKMTSAGLLELPEMKPGAQYSVAFDANAPSEKGYQVMTWIVQGGFCFPYVAIFVR